MPETGDTPQNYPPSIANWRSSAEKEPWLATLEFPLFTDAWITGETEVGPYRFINTVAGRLGAARPAIVLRYPAHRPWDYPRFDRTRSELYHAGSPQEELAALASLAMGIRMRAGRETRRFEPVGDPLGTPSEIGDQAVPYLQLGHARIIPSAAGGQHALGSLTILSSLPTLLPDEACVLVRSARMYQDAMWLAESEPELSWLLMVSALETAAVWWRSSEDEPLARLRCAHPSLFETLSKLGDQNIAPQVAEAFKDSLGVTKKFVDFVLTFRPPEPAERPPFGAIDWSDDSLRRILKKVYNYRSKALHEGRPFPAPMCQPPHLPNGPVPCERPLGHTSMMGGVWLEKDIPLLLHTFEYVTRLTLLNWLRSLLDKQSFRA